MASILKLHILKGVNLKEPIKAGDLCEVIWGNTGQDSLNIGLEVMVEKLRGEHSEHGRIWECRGKHPMEFHQGGIQSGALQVGETADFAASWLKKIEPPVKTKSENKELEMH